MPTVKKWASARERKHAWDVAHREQRHDAQRERRARKRAKRMSRELGRTVTVAEARDAMARPAPGAKRRARLHRAMLILEQGGACDCCQGALGAYAGLLPARDVILCAGCAAVVRILASARGAAVARYLADS